MNHVVQDVVQAVVSGRPHVHHLCWEDVLRDLIINLRLPWFSERLVLVGEHLKVFRSLLRNFPVKLPEQVEVEVLEVLDAVEVDLNDLAVLEQLLYRQLDERLAPRALVSRYLDDIHRVLLTLQERLDLVVVINEHVFRVIELLQLDAELSGILVAHSDFFSVERSRACLADCEALFEQERRVV